jgi:hypothetical protein
VLTNLPEQVTAVAIAQLYLQRWNIEIVHPDYRSSSTLYLGATAA